MLLRSFRPARLSRSVHQFAVVWYPQQNMCQSPVFANFAKIVGLNTRTKQGGNEQMTDFKKKLDDATEQIHENVQNEKDALETERQEQLATERAREETISKAHGVAVQFTQKCIKPITDQIPR